MPESKKMLTAALLLSGLIGGTDGVKLRSTQRVQTKTMAALYPFYHSTDALHDKLVDLASRCPGMTLSSSAEHGEKGDERSIDVVTIRAPDSQPVNKQFMLFGEHSRELISPESGLHFIQSLCGETELSSRAKDVLKDTEFQIVVNGNPDSRRKVEEGDFCLRVNPNGVDLNRNWDEEWQADDTMGPAQTNPGPSPFSEPETRVFKSLVSSYQPSTFLTVHSGTKGMYMPWAYDMEHLASRNEPEMMQILKSLDKDHCQCPFGAAGREVGYSCPGTCLDWVYDKLQTKYSFAFEIYTDPSADEDLRERWQEKMGQPDSAFLQEHANLAHQGFHDVFEKHPSCFVQLEAHKHRHHRGFGMDAEDCFRQFNPNTEELFKSVLENWSAAYLDMANMVASNLKNGVGSTSASNATAAAAVEVLPQADSSSSTSAAATPKIGLTSYEATLDMASLFDK
eukprot:TRINITY_DN2665_c0_g3_i1.p1 TRINITY_DN2665_c0_g3~~TRINITY_DN2665_c0_g3_i1.p1  ORF type:complete len:453 (+),score=128.33 TRINITY_DN2665_c0_g3_i1:55-1413(+)